MEALAPQNQGETAEKAKPVLQLEEHKMICMPNTNNKNTPGV